MEKDFLDPTNAFSSDLPLPPRPVVSVFTSKRALELVNEGLGYQRLGQVQQAITCYQRSITVQPTAEGHCFLGWAESTLGRLDAAIRECKRAIAIDSEFGNAYNDIGSYFVRKGKWNEAVEWFELAKKATRYDSRHYPYLNLGRLYSAQGSLFLALKEFKEAARLAPEDSSIIDSIDKIQRELSI